jgi:hypothetical protein
MLYSGGALERGFRRVINDVPLGSLLVQSDEKTGEPLLLHSMLPVWIRERDLAQDTWVFLLDVQACYPTFLNETNRLLIPDTDWYWRCCSHVHTHSSRPWCATGTHHIRHIPGCKRWWGVSASSRLSIRQGTGRCMHVFARCPPLISL